MSALPGWLVPSDNAPAVPASSGRRISGIARRTLGDLGRLLARSVLDRATADRPGLLQSLDARSKMVGLIGLLVAATFVRRVESLLFAVFVSLVLAAASNIPMRRLAGAWLAAPLFSAAFIFPSTLNWIADGAPIWVVARFPGGHLGPWRMPAELGVTGPGLAMGARFVLRSVVCVSLALLLAATTPPSRLFRGLRALGVPSIAVALLGMMERYLGILIRAAEEIHLAKISRSLSPDGARAERVWIASSIGALFRRTSALGETVFLAMLSRGYTGEVYLSDEPRRRPRDWCFLAAIGAAGAVLLRMG